MSLDVLVVAPHPDDAELGMGGAIMKMLSQGMAVGVLDLTNGEPTPHGSEAIRLKEANSASEVMGLEWRRNLELPNRRLEHTLDARAKLAGVIRECKPKWLFAPYWVDGHPDHSAATELIEAARFWAKLTKSELPGTPHHPQRIFNYYCVHLKAHSTPAFVLDISPFWERKRRALECYHSQFIAGRDDSKPGFIDQLEIEAAWWGKSIGVRYGEPFTSREPIGLSDFSSLV